MNCNYIFGIPESINRILLYCLHEIYHAYILNKVMMPGYIR